MDVTRRQFFSWAGRSVAGAVVFSACGIPDRELRVQSPLKLPEDLVKGSDNWFATLCGQCSDGCGVIVRVMEGRAKKIEGNMDFPINQGRHTAQCEAGLQALYHPDRIKGPLRRSGPRGSGLFQETDWDSALGELAGRMRDLRDAGNADAVALVTEPLRGHLGLVANTFARSYGATHLRYEPMDRVVVRRAIKEVFGQDRLPNFDLEHTQTLLSFGADFLGTWFSPVRMGRGYGEFRQGEGRRRGYFVQVEPRMSQTAASAERWIPISPGMEGALALSLAYVIISQGLGDGDAADALTGGRGAAALEAYAPERIAAELGIPTLRGKDPAETIRELAQRFAREGPSLAIGGGSAAAHTNGLANLVAIYSLNYLVGSVNKQGGVIFNPPSPLKDVPDSASGSTLEEWEELAGRLREGTPRPVNLLLVRGVDPLYSLPASLGLREALDSTFVVSVSNFLDETTLSADLVLPEQMFLEAWGDDIPDPAPGYQVIGVQQPIVNPQPGFDLQGGFGDILLRLAREVSPDTAQALPWQTVRDVLRDGYQEIFDLNRGSVTATTFDGFWTGVLQRGGWWDLNARSTASAPRPKALPRLGAPEFEGAQGAGSFHLIPFTSVGVGDGRHAHLPWLQATPDPMTTVVWSTWVEMNARLAKEMGLEVGDIVVLAVGSRTIEALLYPNPSTPPGVLSVSVGQGHADFGRYARERGSNVLSILAPRKDGGTGALAWAASKASLTPSARHVAMPKFEGTVLAIDPATLLGEPGRIVQVTRE